MNEPAAEAADCRPLTGKEFEQIRQLAYERFGLDLRRGKEELVSARLGKQMRAARFRTFDEYFRNVLEDRTGAALTAMIDALTTNFTGFFREPVHFEFLRKSVLPELKGRIRIWSAACSTGEEPYSIAMAVLEELGWAAASRLTVFATDISTRALAAASSGIYTAERCDGLPVLLPSRYMLRGSLGRYRMKEEIRALIEFRRVNLVEAFHQLGKYHAIFCRNVMIYFDAPTRESLVNRLAEVLEPGGWLFTGHAESLTGIRQPLDYVRPAVYRKRPGRPE